MSTLVVFRNLISHGRFNEARRHLSVMKNGIRTIFCVMLGSSLVETDPARELQLKAECREIGRHLQVRGPSIHMPLVRTPSIYHSRCSGVCAVCSRVLSQFPTPYTCILVPRPYIGARCIRFMKEPHSSCACPVALMRSLLCPSRNRCSLRQLCKTFGTGELHEMTCALARLCGGSC